MSRPGASRGAAADESRGEFARHWRALAGCTIAASIGTIGLNAYTTGAFVPALVSDAGYTREQLSLATLLLSATVAVFAPFIGQAVDRWGALRIITVAVVGETIGFFALGAAPAQFGWFLAAIVLLGVLGVGTTPPGFSRVVAARFDKHRGLALGVMICGLGVTAITAPIIMTRVIEAVGWRGGYWTLSALVLTLGGIGLLLIRSDGPASRADAGPSDLDRGNGGWSVLKRPLYWWIIVAFAAPALFGGGYLLHLINLLLERGFTPGQAAQVQALVGVAIVTGRFTSGLAMDRLFAPYVAAIAFTISAIGTMMLLSSDGWMLSVAALAIGLTIGAELDILAYTLSRYFGLVSFGRLYSLAYSTMILAGGASPLLIARLSPGENYTPAIITSAVGISISAVLVAFLPKFKKTAPASTVTGSEVGPAAASPAQTGAAA